MSPQRILGLDLLYETVRLYYARLGSSAKFIPVIMFTAEVSSLQGGEDLEAQLDPATPEKGWTILYISVRRGMVER